MLNIGLWQFANLQNDHWVNLLGPHAFFSGMLYDGGKQIDKNLQIEHRVNLAGPHTFFSISSKFQDPFFFSHS